jgi:hypothetical protein
MAKGKPDQLYTTELPNEGLSFDIDAFDRALRSQGVTFVHFRAMKCPVGMIDEFDTRRPHEDHSGCSNGFLYTRAGEITCLFTGNSTSSHMTELGIMDGSSVSVTIPRYYDGTQTPLYIAPYDRLFLAEEGIVVPNWQTFRTNGQRDKLSFLAVSVQDLVDSQNRRYSLGDFSIDAGHILWTGSNRPGLDAQSGKGLVCSIRYTYRPFWYVKSLIHEVRVSQAEHPVTGERMVQRMPQAVQLQREYVFEKNERDELAPDKARQVKPPEGPRFGSR